MRSSKTLPTASPRTVYRVFFEILQAGRETVFSQITLREKGIGSNRQALTLMRFLKLLTPSGRWHDDVLSHREDRERLTELLSARLQEACVEVGCDPQAIADLGVRQLAERQLDGLLRCLPPIKAAKHASVVSNMVSCLRAIHCVLEHRCDRQWLEREMGALEARRTSASRTKPEGSVVAASTLHRGCDASSPRILDSAVEPPQSDCGSALGSQGSAARDLDRMLNCVGVVGERFTVGFEENNRPLYAHVYFPAGADADQIEKLAWQLFDAAREKRGQEVLDSTRRAGTARP